MKSTALRANLKQKNMDLIYHDKEHEDFFLQCIYEYENIDVYHISLFYCLGICRDTRAHINDIFDLTSGWTLNAGARYDKHSTAGSETTLSAGLNKRFDENSHAYLNWGQVFKAPTIDDLYYYSVGIDDWGNPYESYGDPNL